MSTRFGGEPNPLDSTGLCLLSLDGGGLRGLSTLYILKGIMDRLNHQRKTVDLPLVKPCEVFDLVGGTSTGGLIAIMLGRLEMGVDECILAYSDLAAAVFEERLKNNPSTIDDRDNTRFNSTKLEKAIQKMMAQNNTAEEEMFNDGTDRGCRSFVCTVDRDTQKIVRLRSYSLPEEPNIHATICQAALASFAATTFFKPSSIGNRTFADGDLVVHNSVDEVEEEASTIWCSDTGDLKPLVKCFISVGTGNPDKKASDESMIKFVDQTVADIVTETENTENRFTARWAKHFDERRYFRFNVEQGLQNIGLNECKKNNAIEAATEEYLTHIEQKFRVRDCIGNLGLKQIHMDTSFATDMNDYLTRIIQRHQSNITRITLPFERNHQFTGRKSQLAQLEKMLFAESRTAKIAITGRNGVGKTQLALELAYRTKDKYKKCAIFWIQTISMYSLQQGYRNIAQELKIPGWEEDKADFRQLVRKYLSKESSGQWLIVFDSVDDTDMLNNESEAGSLIRYLPSSKQGCIVFITCDRKIAVRIAHKNTIEVPVMDEETSTHLLQKCLVDQNLLTNEQYTKALLAELTYLPLAIVQAAAYINENMLSLTEYMLILEDQKGHAIGLRNDKFEDAGRHRNIKDPVTTTWLISFEQIRLRDPLAADYLLFMACIDAKNIPQSLLPPGPSRKHEMNALATLQAYTFVLRPSDIVVHVHQLVHFTTRNWLRAQHLLGHWTEKAIGRLLEVLPYHDHHNRRIWSTYLPHAAYVLALDLADTDKNKRTELLWRYGMCLYEDGRWNEAETSFKQVVETRKWVLGLEHPDTISAMSNLANALGNLGRLDEAAELKEEVLEKMNRLLGDDHILTITAMNNLASTLGTLGQLDAAAKMKKLVLEKRRFLLGEENPSTITAMDDLAFMLGEMGQLHEAAAMQNEVLEKRRRINGEEHPFTISAISNLANTLGHLGQMDEAVLMKKEVLEKTESILGENHPETLLAMNNLAVTLEDLGHVDDAITLLGVAIPRMERIYGKEHPRTKVAISNLSRLTASGAISETMDDKLEPGLGIKSDAANFNKFKLTSADQVIVVLGSTGVGKSYFIQAATGNSSIKVGGTLVSVTDKLTAYRTEIDEQPVVVVDTIGFDDTYRSDTEVLREISIWLAETYFEEIYLAGVLYMYDIQHARYTGSAKKNLLMFEKLVGKAALSNTVLVTNRWDLVNLKDGERKLKELTTTPEMWGDMIHSGCTVERFTGTAQDARRILKSVLYKRRRTILNIQHELVDRQLELSETEAGKTLLEEMNKLQSDHIRSIGKLRVEMNEALKSKDVEMSQMIARQQAELEARLEVYHRQIFELKSQNNELEEIRRMHREELRRVEDIFQVRLRFLEEQNSAPPPVYTKGQVGGADGAQADPARPNPAAVWSRSNNVFALLTCVYELGQRLLRPRIRVGYKRLEWRCTCGELLYGDFRETTPGSLDKLAARLNEHSGSRSQQGVSTSLPNPAKTQLRSAALRVGWNMPGGGNNDSNDRTTAKDAPGSNAQQRQALQLCIETGRFTVELNELDLEVPHSDGFLFERIREKYERAHRSILPFRLRFSKPDKAIFLKFRLGRRPFISRIAGTMDTPSIPSEEEVRAGNYKYLPCPIDEPIMDNRTFFHHFYAPASKHPDMMWGMRLPWKLGPGLAPMAQGWGIHLEESPDWPLFAAFMFFLTLLSGLVAGIYSWRTGDKSTGVAIGAWLSAVQTMGMTSVFFWWK